MWRCSLEDVLQNFSELIYRDANGSHFRKESPFLIKKKTSENIFLTF